MRCDYCGWHNSDEVSRCVKCNQPLADSDVDISAQSYADLNNEKTLPLNATVTFHSMGNTPEKGVNDNEDRDLVYCISCGYPMPLGSRICSACGSDIDDEPHGVTNINTDMMKKTVVDAANIVAHISASEAMANKINTKATVRDIGANTVKAMPNDNKMTVKDIRDAQTDTPQGNMQVTPDCQMSANMKATVRDFTGAMKQADMTTVVLKKTVRDFGLEECVESIDNTVSEIVVDEQPTLIGAKFLPMENFDGKLQPVVITTESAVLNRESVDPNNLFIEEDSQATISYEDGAWYIKNEGKTHAVYVCPNHKVKIEMGDVIVIGNRRYIFSK